MSASAAPAAPKPQSVLAARDADDADKENLPDARNANVVLAVDRADARACRAKPSAPVQAEPAAVRASAREGKAAAAALPQPSSAKEQRIRNVLLPDGEFALLLLSKTESAHHGRTALMRKREASAATASTNGL